MLSDQQIERYSRQIILPQWGGRGQETLLAASIAIVGSDAISTAAAMYLAGAGVGRLALSAPAPLSALDGLNPDCRTTALPTLLTPAAADEVARCDVVLVCGAASGTWQTLNAACIAQRTPLVWGETAGSRGLVAVFAGHRPASACDCLRAGAGSAAALGRRRVRRFGGCDGRVRRHVAGDRSHQDADRLGRSPRSIPVDVRRGRGND